MPEGHTLHRLAREHRSCSPAGRCAVSSPQGRFADGAALLDGRVLRRTEAYGKHLLHHYGAARSLHVHLGLYGKFTERPRLPPEPAGRCGCGWRPTSAGPTCAGRPPASCSRRPRSTALFARLGPDPLRRDADPARPTARISRSRDGGRAHC